MISQSSPQHSTVPTTDPREVLVIQHAAHETPGLIGRALDDRGIAWRSVTVMDDPHPALPDVRDLAGLVVMGGAPGALDDDAHPGLAAERALLARAVAAGVPVLGVCLGMQLLAVALGAGLHSGHGREVGVGPIAMTGDGLRDAALYPLTVDASPDPDVVHWHSDAVDAPAGATILASSAATPVQAFRIGSALALQFHLELDGPLLREWLATPEMIDDLEADEAATMLAAAAARFPSLVPRALVVFGAYADSVRAYCGRTGAQRG